MKKLILYSIFFLSFFLWSLSDGFSKDDSLPSIDSEILIMGLKHTESLIFSGEGRLHFAQVLSNGKVDEFDAIFAFDHHKTYYYYESGKLEGMKYLLDKDIQVTLYMRVDDKGEVRRVNDREKKVLDLVADHLDTEPMSPDEDPRNWGIYWYSGIPISQFLEKHNARIVCTEDLKFPDSEKKVPCYVVEIDDPGGITSDVQFWIAPKEGFRCVQLQKTQEGRAGKSRWKKSIIYRAYNVEGKKAYFPKKGILEIFAVSNGQLTHTADIIIEIKDFHPNVDISDLFHVDVDQEALIWDRALSRLRHFKELGWKY